MSNYTLTHSEGVQGWPSFYSYYPDWMIGMNNYFYTFKGANLYRHSVNSTRNTFYLDWWTRQGFPQNAFTPTRMLSVFNDAPLENKLFKTLNLEGDAKWSATLQTDLQTSGFIQAPWFEKKEQSFFAFIRNSGTTPASPEEYPLRSVNGIGRSTTINSAVPSAVEVNFQISPTPISIGSIMSIGDILYYSLPPYNTAVLFGRVTDIIVDYPSGLNRIVVNTTIPLATIPAIQDPYIMFIKNSVAESHGVLGHYCVFDIQNSDTVKVELFAVESEVMKSYP
jgi:hypothetical protein